MFEPATRCRSCRLCFRLTARSRRRSFPNRLDYNRCSLGGGSCTYPRLKSCRKSQSSRSSSTTGQVRRVIGTAYAAKAAPDGYSWAITELTPPTSRFSRILDSDPIKDFAPIIAERHQLFVVDADLPIKSIGEFLQSVTQSPARPAWASSASPGYSLPRCQNPDQRGFCTNPLQDAVRRKIGSSWAERLNGVFAPTCRYHHARAKRQGARPGGHLAERASADAGRSKLTEAGVPDYELCHGARILRHATPVGNRRNLNRLLRAEPVRHQRSVRATSAHSAWRSWLPPPEELTAFLNAKIRKWSDMIRYQNEQR